METFVASCYRTVGPAVHIADIPLPKVLAYFSFRWEKEAELA